MIKNIFRKYIAENGRFLLLSAIVFTMLMGLFSTCAGMQECRRVDHAMRVVAGKEAPSFDGELNFSKDIVAQAQESAKYRTNAFSCTEPLFLLLLLLMGGMLLGSRFVENPSSKPGRLALLMLPATSRDKFLVRWIVTVPCFLAVFLLSFVVADVMSVVVCSCVYPDVPFVHLFNYVEFFQSLVSGKDRVSVEFCNTLGLFLMYQSFYIYGSTVWHRNSFVKTSIVLFIFLSLMGFLWASFHVIDWMEPLFFDIGGDMLWLFDTVIAALFWVASYVHFRKLEIVHRLYFV